MKKSLLFTLMLSVCLLAFISCGGSIGNNEPTPSPAPSQYSILGAWTYTMMAESEGDPYEYDSGTITFAGNQNSGTYTQLNFYDIEYTGDYTVSGDQVTITGAQTWTGTFTDATHLSGTWEAADHSAEGTWTATKQ